MNPWTGERSGVYIVLEPLTRDAAVEAPVVAVRRSAKHVHESSEYLSGGGGGTGGEGKGKQRKKRDIVLQQRITIG